MPEKGLSQEQWVEKRLQGRRSRAPAQHSGIGHTVLQARALELPGRSEGLRSTGNPTKKNQPYTKGIVTQIQKAESQWDTVVTPLETALHLPLVMGLFETWNGASITATAPPIPCSSQ